MEPQSRLRACSSAERNRKTLELVRPALGTLGTMRLEPELYAASADELLERVRVVPEEVDSVMLVVPKQLA